MQAIRKGLKKYGIFVADNGIDWAISVTPDPRIPVLREELRRIKGLMSRWWLLQNDRVPFRRLSRRAVFPRGSAKTVKPFLGRSLACSGNQHSEPGVHGHTPWLTRAPAFLRGQNLNNKLNIAFIACGGRAQGTGARDADRDS